MTSTDLWDVAVVGAGPAGCAAAITLARAERRVIVVDKARFPRPKACGDGLTAGSLRLLELLGLDPTPIATWLAVDNVNIRSPSGRTVEFPLPRNNGQFAAVVPRADLDNALVEQAKAAGATVAEGGGSQQTQEHTDRVVLDVEGTGEIHARYVIAADGMWSPTRKHLGLTSNGYRGDWHAFRQYWTGVSPAAGQALWVWFEEEILPGYAWLFPLPDGRANVGFGVRRDGPIAVGDMGQLWRELLEKDHIQEVLGSGAEPEEPHRAWPIPARIDKIPLTAGRTMFVGDAAAATDPMTGEGIAQALLTGIGAAQAVISADPQAAKSPSTSIPWMGPKTSAQAHKNGEADQVMARYNRFARRELFADHRMARRLGRVLASRPGARAAVRIAGLTSWTRRNFARWLFEDYPRSLLTTPRRWPRTPRKPPGAYR